MDHRDAGLHGDPGLRDHGLSEVAMTHHAGKSIGRRVITSARLMSLLPLGGVVVAVLGVAGIVLGVLATAAGCGWLPGTALIVLGLGQLLIGVVLYLAMCVLQDLLGIL